MKTSMELHVTLRIPTTQKKALLIQVRKFHFDNNNSKVKHELSLHYSITETSNNITLPYLGEEIEANIAFDKFRFGPHYESGLTENNIKFGIVNKLPIAYEDLPTDGVLGLGQYSQQGFDSPFVQLLKRGNLPNPVLSIYVPRHSTPTSSAVISLGTEDLENCQKVTALHDSAIVSGRNWAFQITGTVIGVRSNYEVVSSLQNYYDKHFIIIMNFSISGYP